MAQKSLNFKQYRAADLTIFAIILCALEGVIGVAANKWFPEQFFIVTLVYAVVCLVFMRWGAYGVIHAVLGGLTYALANGGDAKQYVIYALGNAFVALTMLYVHFVGKEKIRKSVLFSIIHVLLTFVSVAVGRTVLALVFGGKIDVFVTFVATDSLSGILAIVIVLISRRQNGLYEDQKTYLLRTEKQRMKELRQSTVEEDEEYVSVALGKGASVEEQDILDGNSDVTEEQLAAVQRLSAEFCSDDNAVELDESNADNGEM